MDINRKTVQVMILNKCHQKNEKYQNNNDQKKKKKKRVDYYIQSFVKCLTLVFITLFPQLFIDDESENDDEITTNPDYEQRKETTNSTKNETIIDNDILQEFDSDDEHEPNIIENEILEFNNTVEINFKDNEINPHEVDLILVKWMLENNISKKAVNQLLTILNNCTPTAKFPKSVYQLLQRVTSPIKHLLMKPYYLCCGMVSSSNKCNTCKSTIPKPSFFARKVYN